MKQSFTDKIGLLEKEAQDYIDSIIGKDPVILWDENNKDEPFEDMDNLPDYEDFDTSCKNLYARIVKVYRRPDSNDVIIEGRMIEDESKSLVVMRSLQAWPSCRLADYLCDMLNLSRL